MSVTLEELLESSGINSLKGEEQEKTASDNAQDEDLVSALRKMAEAQPTPENTKKLAAQELVEKTAEIAVIAQTLSEIEKVASGSPREPEKHQKLATFIKVALDSGYSKRDIASFLKEGGRIGRAIKSVVQAVRRPIARAGKRTHAAIGEAEDRLLREKLLAGNQKEITKHLNALKSQYGKSGVVKKLQQLKDDLGHLPYPAMKELPRGGKVEKTIGLRIGKKNIEIPESGARTGAIVGGSALGGVALGSRGSNKGGGRVTVVGN